ncbi:MAG: AAA family ATPase, partial [Salinisphaera sp.]|nr:AAA family ATPase [Salinisphaera sp.]
MVPRSAQAEIRQLAAGYPVIVVVGPRQSGKTTLCRAIFANHSYVSLEDPDVLRFATEDPRGFLDQYASGALFDEVQRAPALLSYLQTMVDADDAPGRFVLTGSSQLDVLAGVTQTLAGRAAIVELLPFSLPELQAAELAPDDLETLLYHGLYPPIYDRGLDATRWYGNYVRTYVERDLRQLINVRDLSAFQTFLRLCAGRTGQLISLSSLAADAGITHNTAKAWISALEASFIVRQLRPHFA